MESEESLWLDVFAAVARGLTYFLITSAAVAAGVTLAFKIANNNQLNS